MINKKTFKDIEKIAIKIDHDNAFNGKSKGNQHLFRVIKLAEYLAKKLNADVDIAIAGAWLHDTALPSGNDYDYDSNKKIILNILKKIDLNEKDKESIAECVASHEGTSTPRTLEAKIVHDADVLEKVGLLGVIRHTWKLTNLNEIDPNKITDNDVDIILNHINWRVSALQTTEGKKMAEKLHIKNLENIITKDIIEYISNQAYNGIITEKIAESLKNKLDTELYKKLQNQILQDYLI